MYFDKKLFHFHVKAESQQEILSLMAQDLHAHNVVKDDFLAGILAREEEYPTGLSVNSVGFALPHTDSSRVKSSQICFASLADPIIFHSMTDKSEQIPVRFIFMLAMKAPHEQIENLQNLIGLFQNEECIELLQKCNSDEEFISILASAGVK